MNRHAHDHHGAALAEVLPEPSLVATVVLEVGEGMGALVIHTPESLDGQEIEIRPEGTEWRNVHTAVRRRIVPSGTQYAAVFGSLAQGRYELRIRGSAADAPRSPRRSSDPR